MFHVNLKRVCNSLLLDGGVHKCSLGSVGGCSSWVHWYCHWFSVFGYTHAISQNPHKGKDVICMIGNTKHLTHMHSVINSSKHVKRRCYQFSVIPFRNILTHHRGWVPHCNTRSDKKTLQKHKAPDQPLSWTQKLLGNQTKNVYKNLTYCDRMRCIPCVQTKEQKLYKCINTDKTFDPIHQQFLRKLLQT